MFRMVTIMIVLFFLTGCSTLFKPQSRSASSMDLPMAYSLYTSDDPGPGTWWEAFDCEELNVLMKEALSGNFDIRNAWSRLKQADAVARKAGASLKPSVDVDGGVEKSWEQSKTDGEETQHTDSKKFSAGLSASYEIDLWGRLSALRQSEYLEFQAAGNDLEAAAVTVSAEIVTTWVNILVARRQIAILKEQIAINQSLFNLQKFRFANGKATALEVSQQIETMATAKARLPLLQLTETQQLNALAVLLGRSGTWNLSVSQQDLPGLIPIPDAGLPVDLLAARPDVRAAGLRLNSADFQVSAARADRLPSITLSARAAFSSGSADLLFNNWVSTLAASITGPLFDAGYRSAEVDRTRAVAEEYLSGYAKTVAVAVQEVEDCLAMETRQKEYIVLLKDQLRASELTLKDARIQYMNGQNDYLNYLTAWTSVQDLERQMVAEQATLIKNRVSLYRAIGGDWTRKLIAGPANSHESKNTDKPADVTQPATAG